MSVMRSATGATLAALYALAFVVAYVHYRGHADEWFADSSLILVALPFVLTMRFLSGGAFALTGEYAGRLLAAALFCCALAWTIGAALEWLARAGYRLARRQRAGRE